VYESQEQILAPATGVSRQIDLPGARPMLLRNNRVLIFLTYTGSVASLILSLAWGFSPSRIYFH